MRENTGGPIHFLSRREKWQQKKETDFFSLIEQAGLYAERSTSFREKMRALYLFRELTGYQRTKGTDPGSLPERIFHTWYLCDYVTVKNERIIERFMKEKRRRDDWEFLSRLIVSYSSVFRVVEDAGNLSLHEWAGETLPFPVGDRVWNKDDLKAEYCIARPVKVGVKTLPLGPVIPLREKTAQKMTTWLEQQLETVHIPFRIFMQQKGLGIYRFLFQSYKEEC
ncbi:hypothetical protein [Lihuaxuella thermophila]|uniref:Uncharacterized protein n=1 Tax=Lihuaxuella thermophila TaxID=1173111 RepID=A0A1H8DIF9_9BACL|nr:hypothetical protein [Lihuaxuella thermophila]SEN06946.1 hypothetical protein SAMN05444955_105193 [Lihuaxuella thermophila]